MSGALRVGLTRSGNEVTATVNLGGFLRSVTGSHRTIAGAMRLIAGIQPVEFFYVDGGEPIPMPAVGRPALRVLQGGHVKAADSAALSEQRLLTVAAPTEDDHG